jgi:adenosine deaminase
MAAFQMLAEATIPVTIHAGEAGGLASIWEAVTKGGARRIGHGVALVEDIAGLGLPRSPAGRWGGGGAGGATGPEYAELGALAHWSRDWGIVLEMCPSSNVQTGAVESVAAHPITALKHCGFPVTINTDNRLMSGTSMTREVTLLMAEAAWTLADVRDATITAARGAFIHADERAAIVAETIAPAYARALRQPR